MVVRIRDQLPAGLGTYLTSLFALLVGVFPRDRTDLAVYVLTVLKMASAAALMALLLTLRSGRRWAAGVLGGSYALCGWSVVEASYNPMWLDGLVALPLLCLAGERSRTGRHRIAAPRIAGWSCQGRPADSHPGLVSTPVPAHGTAVDCSFRPPGLRAGTAVGAGAVLALLATGVWGARRRCDPAPQ